ncbi:hypothetical protein [Algoriphagus faecimaris]|nr:hypothetical protein [Algoriphagus faecimaris]
MRCFYITLFSFIIIVQAHAQVKIEREIRVNQRDVPEEAVIWLEDAFETIKKPKWYKEFFETGFSYEAKFYLKKRFYSVEFDSLGMIEDVEIEMDESELSEHVNKNLQAYFKGNYQSFKIEKIQIQYTGDPDDLEDFFDESEKEGITTRYEIEYRAKPNDGSEEIWEGTFDQEGRFISKRKIEIRITDNLIF